MEHTDADQWSEAEMDVMFSIIFENLKGQDITQKKWALENITEYVRQINVGSSSAGSRFQTHLIEVVEEILGIQENCGELTLEASKFWNYYLDNQWPLEEQFLSRIVQVLLLNLPYVQDDDLLYSVQLNEANYTYPFIELIALDVQPSLREYTASALKKLAAAFRPHILQPCMQFIEENVMDTNIAGWKKESAILALGLISAPCMDVLGPLLSKLAPWMPLYHHIPLIAKTTKWAISQCGEVYMKVCPMTQIIALSEIPTIKFIPSRYFTDWAEASFALDNYNQRDDKMELSRSLDRISRQSISREQELIVLKLIWESQTQDQVMPESWMHNFDCFLNIRPVLNVAPPPDFMASHYVELNPAFNEKLEIYFQPLPNSSSGILEKSEKKTLTSTFANGGKNRSMFLRLCRRVTLGLHILDIRGDRLIDDTSIVLFFLPYENEEENGLDPSRIDERRKRILNNIHKLPAQDLWGFQVIRYEYKTAEKVYFQLNG